jgi:hypothetical protein
VLANVQRCSRHGVHGGSTISHQLMCLECVPKVIEDMAHMGEVPSHTSQCLECVPKGIEPMIEDMACMGEVLFCTS